MRIMPLLAGASQGGAETFFVDLCAALARAGAAPHPVIRPRPEREAALRRAGMTVRTAPFGQWLDTRTAGVLRRAVAEVEPDVVLAFMNRAAAWMPAGPHLKIARLGGYYDLKYYRRCDHLVCITPDIRDHVVRAGWPPDRAHVLRNFATVDADPPADRAALDTPPDAPVVLVTARLHPSKGIDTLLRALRAVPEAVLWVAGDGPERTALQRLAAHLGVAARVRFLGWRHDRGALYRAADIAVVPSRHEPFGTVNLEAWAYARPLVTTDAPGPAGLVRPETDALMVPREDAAALADALRRVLAEPQLAARLAAAGRARYTAGFDETAGVARYLELLRDLAANRGPGMETP
jgi:glycosyltransferase involved in cell wall biosynthesis